MRKTVPAVVWVELLNGCARTLHVSQSAVPLVRTCEGWRWRSWRWTLVGSTPLWTWWTTKGAWLIRLWVNVLWKRSIALVWQTGGRLTLQQSQTSLDVNIGGVELCGSGVGIERVVGLVVTRLVQSTKIVPNLGDVWVQTNGAGVSVKSIAVLVDLVVQDTNGAPESWIPAVAVDSLLVSLVCLWILLLRHVAAAEEVPTLRIGLVCIH